MKILALLVLVAAPLLSAAQEIVLPAKLAAYEEFIVRTLQRGIPAANDEGTIRVTVASGHDGAIVAKQDVLELPRGSSASEASAAARKKGHLPLVGWPQGLVVIRRKVGDKIERISWSQRESRAEAPKFMLRDGDCLIGLVYGDY